MWNHALSFLLLHCADRVEAILGISAKGVVLFFDRSTRAEVAFKKANSRVRHVDHVVDVGTFLQWFGNLLPVLNGVSTRVLIADLATNTCHIGHVGKISVGRNHWMFDPIDDFCGQGTRGFPLRILCLDFQDLESQDLATSFLKIFMFKILPHHFSRS